MSKSSIGSLLQLLHRTEVLSPEGLGVGQRAGKDGFLSQKDCDGGIYRSHASESHGHGPEGEYRIFSEVRAERRGHPGRVHPVYEIPGGSEDRVVLTS